MARFELHIQTGKLKGFRVPVEDGRPLTIGRAAGCELRIREHDISREHCRLQESDGAVELFDLGSANGTRLNGESIAQRRLEDGDLIAIGQTVLRFCARKDASRLVAADTAEDNRAPPVDDRVQENARGTPISKTETAVPTLLPQDTLLFDGDLGLEPSLRKKFSTASRPLVAAATQLYAADSDAQTRLAAIYELSEMLFSERSIKAVLDRALETILAVSGADRGAILLPNTKDGTLETVAQRAAEHASRQAGQFEVSRTIVEETLRQEVSLLSSDARGDDRFRQGASVLLQNVRSVMCVPLSARDHVIGVIYVDSISVAAVFGERDLDLLAAIGQQAGVALERARLIADLENLFVGAMLAITASIEAKDAYTRGHSERVTLYALMLADRLGLSAEQRDVVELGGLLHDVGKIGIPESVLGKPGALTDEEFLVMKQHPVLGVRIVSNMPELDRIVSISQIVSAVRHHHEKFDGSGYPDGKIGEEIPLAGRILAVADTYDAITTDRPYRKGCDRAVALRVLKTYAGSQFDPQLVAAFVDVVGGDSPPSLVGVRGRFRVTQYTS